MVNTRRSDNFNGGDNMSQHVTMSKHCQIKMGRTAATTQKKYSLKMDRENGRERSEKKTKFGGTGWKGTFIKMASALRRPFH